MTKQILNAWFAFISKFITWHCTVYTILEIHGPGYRDLNNITSVTSVHDYSNITSVNIDQVPTSPWFGWADWLRRADFLLSQKSAVPFRIRHARRQLAVSEPGAGAPAVRSLWQVRGFPRIPDDLVAFGRCHATTEEYSYRQAHGRLAAFPALTMTHSSMPHGQELPE
jgi:hypothetical protein